MIQLYKPGIAPRDNLTEVRTQMAAKKAKKTTKGLKKVKKLKKILPLQRLGGGSV
jgi:hypothetical protein